MSVLAGTGSRWRSRTALHHGLEGLRGSEGESRTQDYLGREEGGREFRALTPAPGALLEEVTGTFITHPVSSGLHGSSQTPGLWAVSGSLAHVCLLLAQTPRLSRRGRERRRERGGGKAEGAG